MNATELQALADLAGILAACFLFAAIGTLLCALFMRGGR